VVEPRTGAAAEIDHVGPLCAQCLGACQQAVKWQQRRIDDLSEDARVMARQILRRATAAEIGRQVGEFIRSALEWQAEFGGQAGGIDAGSRGRSRGLPARDGADGAG
jgi:hypothetical protein